MRTIHDRRLGRARQRAGSLGIAVLLLTLIVGSLSAPATQGIAAAAPRTPQATPAATDCAPAMPVADIKAGMVGQGLTVVKGTRPEPFKVTVLGVLANAVAPGRDLIIVEVADLPGGHVIDQGGGFWGGISGSPVYVGQKLLGALAFGLTLSPSPIGGLTPAADMAKIVDLSTATAPKGTDLADSITLDAKERQDLAKQAEAPIPQSLPRLPVSMSASGLGPNALARLQASLDRAGMSVVIRPGTGRAGGRVDAPLSRPVNGGNFVASVSYGDVALSAAGTTTWVCGDKALAFGHSFSLGGRSTLGADNGTALAIIKDTFGSFKLTTTGAPFGTVDQDRLSGVRAKLGTLPKTSAVTSTIRNLDSRRSRTGVTQVADPLYLPLLTEFGVLGNYTATFDELGGGRATSTWTISGTRAGGKPLSVTRSNRWASPDDATADPAIDVGLAVGQLLSNEFEPVKIDRVTFDSSVDTAYQQLRIVDTAISVNGGKFSSPASVKVRAGQSVSVRVALLPFRESTTRTVTFKLTVPKNAAGRTGTLTLTGGASAIPSVQGDDVGCLLTPKGCDATQGESLDALLRRITSAPRNDDLLLSLALDGAGETAASNTTANLRQTSVVTGERLWAVQVS